MLLATLIHDRRESAGVSALSVCRKPCYSLRRASLWDKQAFIANNDISHSPLCSSSSSTLVPRTHTSHAHLFILVPSSSIHVGSSLPPLCLVADVALGSLGPRNNTSRITPISLSQSHPITPQLNRHAPLRFHYSPLHFHRPSAIRLLRRNKLVAPYKHANALLLNPPSPTLSYRVFRRLHECAPVSISHARFFFSLSSHRRIPAAFLRSSSQPLGFPSSPLVSLNILAQSMVISAVC